jgi:hypothetical protein
MIGDKKSARQAFSRALKIKSSKVDTDHFEKILDRIKVNED